MPENYSTAYCTVNDRGEIIFYAFTVMSMYLENSFEYFYEVVHGISLNYQILFENCNGERKIKVLEPVVILVISNDKSQLRSRIDIKVCVQGRGKVFLKFVYAETLVKRGHFCRHSKEEAPGRHN